MEEKEYRATLTIKTDHNKRGVEAVLRRLIESPALSTFFDTELGAVEEVEQ